LQHLVYQMMNLWLVLLPWYQLVYRDHIFLSLCALSLPLLCFGCSNFWKFIFHKVVQRHVFGVVRSLINVLSQIFRRVCQWKNLENPLRF